MLETEEVDDDYFTPVSSTSLANIFGNKSQPEEGKENASLKYTPPKPVNPSQKPPEEAKPTTTASCVFACALYGHEWCNNIYSSRGKLGFAIMRILKTGYHNIVLYDSNKVTLSCATITPNLEVTIKENVYISYYDNLRKYWSLFATEDEVNKIAQVLQSLNVTVKFSANKDAGPPEPQNTLTALEQGDKETKESDTDSSINIKTKASILSRMANMGHSVLPSKTALPVDVTSDSSDTNESSSEPKIRHKPVKSLVRKGQVDKTMIDGNQYSDSQQDVSIITKIEHVDKPSLYTYINGQLVPVTNTNILTSPVNSGENSINMMVSEQRVNNTELRINMTRMTDKVDEILTSVKELSNANKNTMESSFQNQIMQKLLTEYENKIKAYEKILKAKDIPLTNIDMVVQTDQHTELTQEVNGLKKHIEQLQKTNEEKDEEIKRLISKIYVLEESGNSKLETNIKDQEKLLDEISKLKNDLKTKNEELKIINEKFEAMSSTDKIDNSSEVGNKIKNIMNDTFRGISANFENEESYTGSTVKSVVATVIKRVTIESLVEL